MLLVRLREPRSTSRLFVAYRQRLEERGLTAVPDGLDARLKEAWLRGRRAYPAVVISARGFSHWLADRAEPEAADLNLDALCTEDLLLCCALSHGDQGALRTFESFIDAVKATLSSHDGLEGWTEEVATWLRHQLLVGETRPWIESYAGRGQLLSWMKVLAVREALARLQRASARDPAEARDQLPVDAPDGKGRARLKRRDRVALRRAFSAALSSLGAEERRLLTRYYLQAWTMDEIADAAGLSPSRAARVVARAKRRLARHAQQELAARLDAPRAELDRLAGLLRGGLAVSLGRELARQAGS